jgi:IstB-like ATP binding protein
VGQTFTDPRLAAAVVDRLTFNALIVQTGTQSYRLRATRRARREPPPPADPSQPQPFLATLGDQEPSPHAHGGAKSSHHSGATPG